MSTLKAKTFSTRTLGCKLNQYESECIRHKLEILGFEHVDFSRGADFYVINTCTVTGKTDARCRNAIRRAKKLNPNAVIIATGCYAETQPASLEKMQELDYVMGNRNKNKIPLLIDRVSKNGGGRIVFMESCPDQGTECFINRFHGHSRAFIKIQEGCDAYCSYCIIPYARGRSRSVEPSKVIRQIKRLAESGYEEIVLTGIHIGRYGENSRFEMNLAGLIEMILGETNGVRLRMSSIEVTEITDELIGLFTSTDRVAPHFHIPLQSGDDTILKLMNRKYSSDYYRKKVKGIAESIPNAALGTDIIVGFPGETDDCFNNTLRFLQSGLPLNYFHVFSYSRRPGTKAYNFTGAVNPETKKKRSRTLIELGKAKRRDFLLAQLGNRETALVQNKANNRRGYYSSITGNYCEVVIEADESLKGKLVPVRINEHRNGQLHGEICGEPLIGDNSFATSRA